MDFGTSFVGKKHLYSTADNDFVHLGAEGTVLLTTHLRQCFEQGDTDQSPSSSSVKTDKSKQNHDEGIERDSEEKTIPTRVTRDPPRHTNPQLVHTDSTTCEGGNVFRAFGGPCHGHEEARHFKCRLAMEFPEICSINNLMTVYCFTQENGELKWRCEDDGEKGASPRIKFLMEKMKMNNCIIVVTRHYGGKMFAGRWTAIQNQCAIIAAKLGYNVPRDLDIHAYQNPLNNYRVPARQYSRVPPLIPFESQPTGAYIPHKQNLQRSFQQFTNDPSHDYLSRQNGYHQMEAQDTHGRYSSYSDMPRTNPQTYSYSNRNSPSYSAYPSSYSSYSQPQYPWPPRY